MYVLETLRVSKNVDHNMALFADLPWLDAAVFLNAGRIGRNVEFHLDYACSIGFHGYDVLLREKHIRSSNAIARPIEAQCLGVCH